MKYLNKASCLLTTAGLLLCCMPAFSQSTIIEGTILNYNAAPRPVYLFSFYGSRLQKIDSAMTDVRGKFRILASHVDHTGIYKVGTDKRKSSSVIIKKNEKKIVLTFSFENLGQDILISSREDEAYRETMKIYEVFRMNMDSIKNISSAISVVDSFYARKTKAAEYAMNNWIREFNTSLSDIKTRYKNTFAADVLCSLYMIPQRVALNENYDNDRAYLHDHFFGYMDFSNDQIIYIPALVEKYLIYLEQYTDHSPAGFQESVDLIVRQARANKRVEDFTIEYLLNLFSERGPEYMVDYLIENYLEGTHVTLDEKVAKRAEQFKQASVGHPAPDLILPDAAGVNVGLKKTLEGKKGVILLVWSADCGHCHEQIKGLLSSYSMLRERGIPVYGVAYNSEKNSWIKDLSELQLPWVNVFDEQAVMYHTYAINKVPSFILIDERGIIISRENSAEDIIKKVNQFMK